MVFKMLKNFASCVFHGFFVGAMVLVFFLKNQQISIFSFIIHFNKSYYKINAN